MACEVAPDSPVARTMFDCVYAGAAALTDVEHLSFLVTDGHAWVSSIDYYEVDMGDRGVLDVDVFYSYVTPDCMDPQVLLNPDEAAYLMLTLHAPKNSRDVHLRFGYLPRVGASDIRRHAYYPKDWKRFVAGGRKLLRMAGVSPDEAWQMVSDPQANGARLTSTGREATFTCIARSQADSLTICNSVGYLPASTVQARWESVAVERSTRWGRNEYSESLSARRCVEHPDDGRVGHVEVMYGLHSKMSLDMHLWMIGDAALRASRDALASRYR